MMGSLNGRTVVEPRKIERRCPRCHRHAYHWLNFIQKVAGCVNCGHEWKVRVMERDL